MVMKQFQNFTANKVLTNTRLLFVRALESRLTLYATHFFSQTAPKFVFIIWALQKLDWSPVLMYPEMGTGSTSAF